MTKISVVIPVYNVENYLEQCVDSVLAQTLEDIEVILVNDGSTDKSPLICDDYAKKDSRVRVIHKQNEGLGKAYNTGILAATGEYIGLVESDDFISPTMYEDLYRIAQRQKVDLVKSSWFLYYSGDNSRYKDLWLSNYNSYEVLAGEALAYLITIQASVWSAIYKRDYILKNNVFFLETPGASYQDVSFTYKAIACANGIAVTPDAYVYYRQDNMNSSIKSKDKVCDIFVEYEEVERFFNANPKLKEFFYKNKLVRQYNDYCWNFSRISAEYKGEFLQTFRTQFIDYLNQGLIDSKFFESINEENFNYLVLGKTN